MVVDTVANFTIVRRDVLAKQLLVHVEATTSFVKTTTIQNATVYRKLLI